MNHFTSLVFSILAVCTFQMVNAGTSQSDTDTTMTIEMPEDSLTLQKNQQPDSAAELDSLPRLLTFVKADYPADLVKKGVEGAVLLELLVNESGGVDSGRVVKGLNPLLDSSAVSAARKFKFSPAKAGGASVAVLMQYEYRFSLSDAVDSIKQFVNFSGQILEAGTRKPVSDAMVVLTFKDTLADTSLRVPFGVYLQKIAAFKGQSLEEGHLVATTDSTGHFEFYSLPACSVVISTPVPGYEDYKTREKISKQEETIAKYYVKRISYSDYEIVVYGKIEEKEVARRTLTLQEVKKIPGFGGDAVKVIQAMPGVARPSFGSGEIIVRGQPSWDSRYYLDGIYLPVLYHFGGLKSVYNSDALKEIEFYPGGYGTRYGGGVAGAIEITGREAKKDRWHGTLDLSTLDGYAMVEGPVRKDVSVLFTARRSFVGEIIHTLTEGRKDFPVSLLPYYWDYIGRVDWKVDKRQSVFFTLFGSCDSLQVIVPDMRSGSEDISEQTNQMQMRSLFHMGILGYDFKLNDRWKNSLRYGLTYYKSRYSIFGFSSWNQNGNMNQIRDQITYTVNEHGKVNAGADMQFINHSISLAIPSGGGLIEKDTIDNWKFGVVGAYLNYEWKPLENLLIIPGLRYDYYPELKYDGSIVPAFWDYSIINNDRGISGEPSFRCTARYEVVKNHTLKASVGNYSQTPQPMGQTIHEQWGDPFMPATKAAHYVTGYEWKITDLINLDLQSYFNNQWNIPFQTTAEDLVENSNKNQLWIEGRGRMYGLELMLRHLQSEHFFGWVAYTLSRSERYKPSTKEWQIYSQDETHNLQVLGSWRLPREWELGFKVRYATGKPITPVKNITLNIGSDYYYADTKPQDYNTGRMDPFFQLDLRVDKKFVRDKFISSVYVDFQNISWFFYKSPEQDIYSYDLVDRNRVSMIPLVATGFNMEF
jgi:TonB family protein